jgi:nitrate reductase gamma subunit
MKTVILFRVWPYVALSVLVLGLAARWVTQRLRRPPPLPSWPPPPMVAPPSGVRARSRPWGPLAWCLLALAHVIGILLPAAVLAWNAVPWRLYALEALGLAVGLSALVACAASVRRHLKRGTAPVAAGVADSMFLSLLLLGVLSGLALAVGYRWGSSWSAATLAPYVASLEQGRPQAELVAELPFLVQLHVFAAFAAAAVLPFTSAAGAWLAALGRPRALRVAPASAAAAEPAGVDAQPEAADGPPPVPESFPSVG